jgi:hypothetical protein
MHFSPAFCYYLPLRCKELLLLSTKNGAEAYFIYLLQGHSRYRYYTA